jgi:uncharacterized membrane-anchored protein
MTENISMSDLMRNYDRADNGDFEKELEVTIIEENIDGFMTDKGIILTEFKKGVKAKKLLNTYGHPVLFLTEKLLNTKKRSKSVCFGKHR